MAVSPQEISAGDYRSQLLGRYVVVEEALGDMQELLRRDPCSL